MTEPEYLSKLERLDKKTKTKFNNIFGNIYTSFNGLSYSKVELFLEHLKRTLKKDAICTCQGWEEVPTV